MKNGDVYLFIESFLLFGILLLSLIAFYKAKNNNSTKSILFVFGSFIFHLIFNIIVITGYIHYFPLLILLDDIDGYFFAIAIVYHIIEVTKVKIKLHLLLFSIIISCLISVYYYYSSFIDVTPFQLKNELNSLRTFNLTLPIVVPMLFIQINNLIAAIYVLLIYKKYVKIINNYLANEDLKAIQYVKFFSIVYLTLIIVYSIFVLFIPVAFIQYLFIPTTFYFFFFYVFSTYSKIPSFEKKQNDLISKINAKKEQSFHNDLYENLEEELNQVIIEKGLFKKSNITLYELAKETKLSAKQLSAFFNQKLNTNFSSYINTYRINEAKKLLAEHQHKNLTLEAIAEMSGFNNRVTFYRAFKKIEHNTPTEYIQQVSEN